jgi:hypothetical protein
MYVEAAGVPMYRITATRLVAGNDVCHVIVTVVPFVKVVVAAG